MRPAPITALSVISALSATFLAIAGITMLMNWDMFSFKAGAQLLAGFETAGPFAFLIGAAVYALTAYGLWALRNWARHVTIGIAALQAFLAVPKVSEDAISLNYVHLALAGIPMIAAAAVIFYLAKSSTVIVFQKR
jgi:hypothetical protein